MSPEEYGELVEIARRAFALQKGERYDEAAALWEQIVAADPEWEGGRGEWSLATCYEDGGRPELAGPHYRKAVEVAPADLIHLGGYALFLCLAGDAEAAFPMYLRYMQVWAVESGRDDRHEARPALLELGRKIGLTAGEVERRMEAAVTAGLRGEYPSDPAGGIAP